MPRGTEAQSREVRHRRKITWFVLLANGLIWLAGCGVLGAYYGEVAATSFALLGGLCAFVGFTLFTLSYWRCPACSAFFPRGSNGSQCHACKTEFDI